VSVSFYFSSNKKDTLFFINKNNRIEDLCWVVKRKESSITLLEISFTFRSKAVQISH